MKPALVLENSAVPSCPALSQAKAFIKTGGTNIFNKKQCAYAGGPTPGGLYYVALTFDGLLN